VTNVLTIYTSFFILLGGKFTPFGAQASLAPVKHTFCS
jgi:hypothetical protein